MVSKRLKQEISNISSFKFLKCLFLPPPSIPGKNYLRICAFLNLLTLLRDFKAVLAKALLSLIVYSANDSERGVVPMYQAMQLESSWVKCGAWIPLNSEALPVVCKRPART